MEYKSTYNLVDTKRVQQERIQQMIRSLDSSCLSVYNQKRNFIQPDAAKLNQFREEKHNCEKPNLDCKPYFENHFNKTALLKSVDVITHHEDELAHPLIPPSTLFTEDYITSVIPIVINNSIEYKKVQASYFNNNDKYFEAIEQPFKFADKYISHELIQQLELGKHDTTVVNVGTGYGKSYTARHLIKFYADNGYIVLVACPFILLTNENFGELKGILNKKTKIINYKDLNENNLEEYVQANVHCITINCLMRNPGEDYENHERTDFGKNQSKIKKNYLDNLQRYCSRNHKKVIIFFDEIHAGINNFKPQLRKNLYPWKSLVKKVFVFSATYTEASYIVLAFLAKTLTNKQMTIYNCERRKFPSQANLHINITDKRYTAKDLSPLRYLTQVIVEALSKQHKINILVATRSLTEALTDLQSQEPLAQYICALNPNILLGKESQGINNQFDPDRINIGTTFSTGISIDDALNTFIIITPVFLGPDSQKLASIFMDGSPAIIQALARLRNGGDIHVFMHKPTHMISGSYLETAPSFLNVLQRSGYRDSNDQFKLIKKAYVSYNHHIRNLATFGNIDWNKLDNLNRENFILVKSQYELSSKYEIFGKKVNPFIIWAAYHNQFTNCTLKTINLIAEQSKTSENKVEIAVETIIPDLRNLLSDDIGIKIKGLPDWSALQKLFEEIHTLTVDGVVLSEKREIIYKGKLVKYEHSKYHPAITKALINILYEFKHGTAYDYNTSSHLLENILIAPVCRISNKDANPDNQKKLMRNNLKVAYTILGEVGQLLQRNVIIGDPLLLRTIDEPLEKKICTALHEIRENDFYIRNKIFSFLQTYHFSIHRDGSIIHHNWDVTERHKILIKGLTDIFFESTSKIEKINGKPQRVRRITAEKLPPAKLLDLTFGFTIEDYDNYLQNRKSKRLQFNSLPPSNSQIP